MRDSSRAARDALVVEGEQEVNGVEVHRGFSAAIRGGNSGPRSTINGLGDGGWRVGDALRVSVADGQRKAGGW
ncbi:MAG: hypothetical protein WD894_15305 [Pirellulales bacterium]